MPSFPSSISGQRHGSKRTNYQSPPSTMPKPLVTTGGSLDSFPRSPKRCTPAAVSIPPAAGFDGSWDRQLLAVYMHVAVLGAHMEALVGHPAAAEEWADAAEQGEVSGTLPDG